MTPGNKNLIKFLARVAVEEYLNEISQHRKLPSSLTEKQLANELPEKQIDASTCPKNLISLNLPRPSDDLAFIKTKE